MTAVFAQKQLANALSADYARKDATSGVGDLAKLF